ncbi:hypothetical protein FACS189429_2810 [Bacteroidia bacterium]|nr:hypothetical protein FACS189429_2810 [Bacteroidia bacterium]GHV43747.1 hypothetical protein FACS1894180_3760 [Bacteroidia bacterium]
MKYFSIAGFVVAIDSKILKFKYINDIFNQFAVEKTEVEPLLTVLVDAVSDFEESIHQFVYEELGIDCFFYRTDNRFLRKMIKNDTTLRCEFYETDNLHFLTKFDFQGKTQIGSMLYFALRWACCLALLHRQTLGFHSSTIVHQGKSVLFLGKSGTGKSTHSQLWLNNIEGAELLNDDAPFVQIAENKVLTWGSPWSGKTPCYKNQSAQTVAFVLLQQAPYNKIRQLTLYEALTVLLGSSRFFYFNDEHFTDVNYEIISEILKQIPVYHLECLPDADAARMVLETLAADKVL